jgi:regulator of nonsense transcripts 2
MNEGPGGSLVVNKYDPRVQSEIDAPSDLFRAQLVCEILNTCGVYYVRGHSKEKLTKFLTYFQRYLLTKQYIPLHIEFTILDTLDNLEELAR